MITKYMKEQINHTDIDMDTTTHKPAIFCFGNGVGAALAIVLGHILALSEGSTSVLQHMANAEGIAIEASLLTQLGAVGAEWLVVQLRVVDVFAFVHPVP